jgi:tetratricopeptide (TPR) repeat protein
MQGEVASAIVHEIDVTLTPQEKIRLASGRQVDPAAQEAYLKGRYHWHKGSAEETRKAREYFEQAVRVDPRYAASYAALAAYYSVSTDLPAKEAIPKAKEYAVKALELDDALAQAHTALAGIKFYGDWDWAGAENEYKRALALNPNDAEAHRTYSSYLLGLGRFDEALLEVERAQQLDPLSLYTSVNAGWTFYFVRQYDRAVEKCQQALELDANSDGAHACLGHSDRAKGMREQAISESERAVTLSGRAPARVVGLARAYAAFSKRVEAQKLLEELRDRARHGYVSPYHFAMIYIALGEQQQALASLDQAYAERDRYLTWLRVDDAFDPLRKEPRFQDLLHRIGFPP